MKYLKKPVVALLVAVILVFSSTAISVNVKLGKKCDEVIEGFYYGVRYQGILRKPIYTCLDSLIEYSEEVVLIASNYGLDTREVSSSASELRREISFENHDIGDIYEEYESFYDALYSLMFELSAVELSQRHLELMRKYETEINCCKDDIENSCYNESVRSFYKKFDRFPVNIFAEVFDVDYPDYFA